MAGLPAGDYYDIIIVGETGQGKSTLGNKLLNAPPPREIGAVRQGARVVAQEIRALLFHFRTADDVDEGQRLRSITERCELSINNDIMVRVLDTPGFASSEMQTGVTVYQSNLQIFRWIVHEQLDPNVQMAANRLLYFLPKRGTLRNANGALQEELKVMYHFFGREVFNNMVLIMTQDEIYQHITLPSASIQTTKKAFCTAVELATEIRMNLDTCPPLLYISMNDTHEEVLQAVKQARVLAGDRVFRPVFRDDVCSRCGIKTRFGKAGEKFKPVGILNDGEFRKYEESKCHPGFIQKYSKTAKVAGSIGHTALLGSALAYSAVTGNATWPGFTNSDEICLSCGRAPGSKGCHSVLTEYKMEGTDKTIKVEHTNKL